MTTGTHFSIDVNIQHKYSPYMKLVRWRGVQYTKHRSQCYRSCGTSVRSFDEQTMPGKWRRTAITIPEFHPDIVSRSTEPPTWRHKFVAFAHTYTTHKDINLWIYIYFLQLNAFSFERAPKIILCIQTHTHDLCICMWSCVNCTCHTVVFPYIADCVHETHQWGI